MNDFDSADKVSLVITLLGKMAQPVKVPQGKLIDIYRQSGMTRGANRKNIITASYN